MPFNLPQRGRGTAAAVEEGPRSIERFVAATSSAPLKGELRLSKNHVIARQCAHCRGNPPDFQTFWILNRQCLLLTGGFPHQSEDWFGMTCYLWSFFDTLQLPRRGSLKPSPTGKVAREARRMRGVMGESGRKKQKYGPLYRPGPLIHHRFAAVPLPRWGRSGDSLRDAPPRRGSFYVQTIKNIREKIYIFC